MKKSFLVQLVIPLTLLCFGVVPPLAAEDAKIYRWKDNKGKQYFTQIPPPLDCVSDDCIFIRAAIERERELKEAEERKIAEQKQAEERRREEYRSEMRWKELSAKKSTIYNTRPSSSASSACREAYRQEQKALANYDKLPRGQQTEGHKLLLLALTANVSSECQGDYE